MVGAIGGKFIISLVPVSLNNLKTTVQKFIRLLIIDWYYQQTEMNMLP